MISLPAIAVQGVAAAAWPTAFVDHFDRDAGGLQPSGTCQSRDAGADDGDGAFIRWHEAHRVIVAVASDATAPMVSGVRSLRYQVGSCPRRASATSNR